MVHVYEVGAHLEDWYRANSDQAVSDYWPETQWERQKGQRNSGGKALVYTAPFIYEPSCIFEATTTYNQLKSCQTSHFDSKETGQTDVW